MLIFCPYVDFIPNLRISKFGDSLSYFGFTPSLSQQSAVTWKPFLDKERAVDNGLISYVNGLLSNTRMRWFLSKFSHKLGYNSPLAVLAFVLPNLSMPYVQRLQRLFNLQFYNRTLCLPINNPERKPKPVIVCKIQNMNGITRRNLCRFSFLLTLIEAKIASIQ